MVKKQYRVKTEAEMFASFGEDWSCDYFSKCSMYRTYWSSPNMDYLLGTTIDIPDKYYGDDGSIRPRIYINIGIDTFHTWALTINQLVEINTKPTYIKRKITS